MKITDRNSKPLDEHTHLISYFNSEFGRTPGFLYSKNQLEKNLKKCCHRSYYSLQYSTKSAWHKDFIAVMINLVDGFTVPSLNYVDEIFIDEIKMLHRNQKIGGKTRVKIHLVSPAITQGDVDFLNNIDETVFDPAITFNSMSQLRRFKDSVSFENIFLRINPEISFLENSRHDPCRPDSRLGVSLSDLTEFYDSDFYVRNKIRGFHIHNNNESSQFHQLADSYLAVKNRLAKCRAGKNILPKAFNLGGGYFFDDESYEYIDSLIGSNQDLILEPSTCITYNAGYYMTRIVDIFNSNGKKFIIVDGSTKDLPEINEYGLRYPLVQDRPEGKKKYIIGGSTCLAGDVFGTYSIPDHLLNVGVILCFYNCGAYTHSKASSFNGMPVPTMTVI